MQESFTVAKAPFSPQVLTNQIEHGGEGAEEVVFLDLELQAFFAHRNICNIAGKIFLK